MFECYSNHEHPYSINKCIVYLNAIIDKYPPKNKYIVECLVSN